MLHLLDINMPIIYSIKVQIVWQIYIRKIPSKKVPLV